MQTQYVGFKVKLCSTHLGVVVGTVSKVSETKIELSNAIVNGKGVPIPSFIVESQFIQNIRILSTGAGDSSDDVSPKKDDAVTSARAQRREMLRNMPNACNAYVCPNSPPLIHRSAGIPVQQCSNSGSPGRSSSSNLKQLDPALARITISDKTERKQPKPSRQNIGTPIKRRSRSFSEAVVSNSEISGTESDSFHRCHNYVPRGTYANGSRCGPNRTHSRTGPTSNRNIGNRAQQTTADWDRIRVEDFIDEDFDFEKNLAMFDKNAFYEMVNMREGNAPRPLISNPAPPLSQRDEGPDGVGMPLIGNIRHSTQTPQSNADYHDDRTMTTNTATLSSFKQRFDHHVPYYHPSTQRPCGDVGDSGCVTNVSSRSHVACTTRISQAQYRFWYSSTGLRVPVLSVDDQIRMLHYLATGRDSHKVAESAPLPELPTLAQGFTWGRLLETAGRSLVDHIMTSVRQTNQTPQRFSHRPPPRVLVLPGGPHLSGAFCVTLARLLAIRGACVLAIVPKCALSDTLTGPNANTASVYRTELNLVTQFAPRPSQYGLEEEDDTNKSVDEYDDEEEAEDSAVSDAFDVSSTQRHVFSDTDSQRASCMTLDQLVQHEQATDPLDYSPVHRMWLSRMPGFKILHRPLSILKIPTNVRVDLVIVGHGTAETNALDPHVIRWLGQHQALSCFVHVMPHTNVFTEAAFYNAPSRWIVELGMPVLSPNNPTDSSSPPSASCCSHSTSHLLVDVGLSRNLVRRLISDLKSLPPYGLFDTGSIIELHSSPNPNASVTS